MKWSRLRTEQRPDGQGVICQQAPEIADDLFALGITCCALLLGKKVDQRFPEPDQEFDELLSREARFMLGQLALFDLIREATLPLPLKNFLFNLTGCNQSYPEDHIPVFASCDEVIRAANNLSL